MLKRKLENENQSTAKKNKVDAHNQDSNSVDFRNCKFNLYVDLIKQDIYHLINSAFHKKELTQNDIKKIQKKIKTKLNALRKELKAYYQKDQLADTQESQINAKTIYSEYLQSLIYFSCHPRDWATLSVNHSRPYIQALIDMLLKDDNLLFVSKFGVSLWVDPKEKHSILHVLMRYHTLDSTLAFIDKAKAKYKDYATKYEKTFSDEWIKFLTVATKNGFMPLNQAAKENMKAVVEILIKEAKEAYGNDLNSFIDFLNQPNNEKFTPFNSAVKEGRKEIVEVLIKEAKRAYEAVGDKNKNRFINEFINTKNELNFTPINNAAKGYKEYKHKGMNTEIFKNIILTLMENGADPYFRNQLGFNAFDNSPEFADLFKQAKTVEHAEFPNKSANSFYNTKHTFQYSNQTKHTGYHDFDWDYENEAGQNIVNTSLPTQLLK